MAEPLPGGPSDLNAAWLTAALRQTGTISSDTTVTSFGLEPVGEGAGFLGQLTRVTLTYERARGTEPASLVGKFPAAATANREFANLLRFYERELRFYDEIAAEVELRTPTPYFTRFDPETGGFVLLMEDLSGVGNQVAGCPPDRALDTVERIARFHATWWDSPRLAALDWIPYPNAPVHHASQKQYQLAWPRLLDTFGARMPRQAVAAGERLQTKLLALQDAFAKPPLTICHGDLRYDNLFFGRGEPVFADWHIVLRCRGARDVGYFLSQSVNSDVRRTCEMQVIHRYHDTLTANGVSGYTFDECFDDYRRGALYCLLIPVLGLGSWNMANERGLVLMTTMLDRAVATIVDLRCDEMIPT